GARGTARATTHHPHPAVRHEPLRRGRVVHAHQTSWQTRDRHELDWDLYPAAHVTSRYTLYEDDGVTRDFAKGAAATQRVSVHADGNGTTVSVGASNGDYAGKVDARAYRFTVHGDSAPRRILLDGRQLPASAWSYDAGTHVTTITTPSLALERGFTVRLVDQR
ncbi:DUF5110 domain-containing protein, partial [Streptomyces sp. NPDC052101]|uniref:DUF5110 domain-containing protein n=1 Tax=Streptomyces sp. NPDC052101 TaxID=3155763 RepID=UPI003428E547